MPIGMLFSFSKRDCPASSCHHPGCAGSCQWIVWRCWSAITVPFLTMHVQLRGLQLYLYSMMGRILVRNDRLDPTFLGG